MNLSAAEQSTSTSIITTLAKHWKREPENSNNVQPNICWLISWQRLSIAWNWNDSSKTMEFCRINLLRYSDRVGLLVVSGAWRLARSVSFPDRLEVSILSRCAANENVFYDTMELESPTALAPRKARRGSIGTAYSSYDVCYGYCSVSNGAYSSAYSENSWFGCT